MRGTLKAVPTAPGVTVKFETGSIPAYVARNVSQIVFAEIHRYFEDPEVKADYERWKAERAAKCKVKKENEKETTNFYQIQPSAAEIAARANGMVTTGEGFHVEMMQDTRGRDKTYGATRPVAYVVADGNYSIADESENKIFSSAVQGRQAC